MLEGHAHGLLPARRIHVVVDLVHVASAKDVDEAVLVRVEAREHSGPATAPVAMALFFTRTGRHTADLSRASGHAGLGEVVPSASFAMACNPGRDPNPNLTFAEPGHHLACDVQASCLRAKWLALGWSGSCRQQHSITDGSASQPMRWARSMPGKGVSERLARAPPLAGLQQPVAHACRAAGFHRRGWRESVTVGGIPREIAPVRRRFLGPGRCTH